MLLLIAEHAVALESLQPTEALPVLKVEKIESKLEFWFLIFEDKIYNLH